MYTYEVKVSRDDRWWLIEVPAVPAGVSQARRLADVEPMARELVSLLLQVPEDSFGLSVQVDVPPSVRGHIETARRLRHEAESARAQSLAESRAAARELQAGLTVSDIGEVLGVSFQRAAQLING